MTAAAPTAPRIEVGKALKNAALTALISFALLLPLIGFKTVQNMRNELELETRIPLLIAIVAVITAAKLLGSLVIEPWRERRVRRAAPASARVLALKSALSNWFTPFALGFVIVYPILIMVFFPQGAQPRGAPRRSSAITAEA